MQAATESILCFIFFFRSVLECSIKQGDKDTDMYSSAVKKKKRQTQMQQDEHETRDKTHGELGSKKSNCCLRWIRTGRSFDFL